MTSFELDDNIYILLLLLNQQAVKTKKERVYNDQFLQKFVLGICSSYSALCNIV